MAVEYGAETGEGDTPALRTQRLGRSDDHPVSVRRRIARWIHALGLSVLLSTVSCASGTVPPRQSSTEARAPVDTLALLADPIVSCIGRSDTWHPVFHGCVDWHSAVHATLALLLLRQLGGASPASEAALARVLLDRVGLATEKQDLSNGRLTQELPYGYAWMLLVDTTARRLGVLAFRDLGEAIAPQLLRWLSALGAEQRAEALRSENYGNATWPAFALLRWAGATGHWDVLRAVEAQVVVMTQPRTQEAVCAVGTGAEFFSPCHMLVLVAGEACRQVPIALRTVRMTRPLTDAQMQTTHSAGLNFSRAWGASAAYRLTGDPQFLRIADDLIRTDLQDQDRWRRHYDQYSHWVAQFGVFAVVEQQNRVLCSNAVQ